MSEPLVAQVLRTVSTDVLVGVPPVDAVVEAGRRRARTRLLALGSAAVAAVVAVVATAAILGGGSSTPQPAGVVRVENPLPLTWWGDGTLHLAHVTVPVSGLTDVVILDGAAAYGNEDGDVVLVDGDGRRTTVGHKSSEAPMAGAVDSNWLAWVDPGEKAPQLVVYDVTARSELGRLDLPYRGLRWERLDAGSYPIRIDSGRVYYATQDGDSWSPDMTGPHRETPADIDLLDARGDGRVAHAWSRDQGWAEDLVVTWPGLGDDQTYRGSDGWFSPDGHHLAIRSGDRLRLFATASHDPLLDLDESADLGIDQTFVFADDKTVVSTAGGRLLPEPTESPEFRDPFSIPGYDTWDLITCDIDSGACATIRDVTTEAPPVLPE